MRWKTVDITPIEGYTRLRRKFAFLPTTVGDYTVWLETYESVQVYRFGPRATKVGTVHKYAWDEIERNLLVLYP